MSKYSGEKKALSPSEKTALLYILTNGPTHGYTLMSKASLTTNTAYAAPKALVKMGLLEMKEDGEKPRPGQPMKKYYLTFVGLCTALQGSEDAWKKIDEITKRWRYLLPSIFGKWEFFKKHRLLKEANRCLKRSTADFLGFLGPEKERLELAFQDYLCRRYGVDFWRRQLDPEKELLEARKALIINYLFLKYLFDFPSYDEDTAEKLWVALRSDQELKQSFETCCEVDFLVAKGQMAIQEYRKSLLGMLDMPDLPWKEISQRFMEIAKFQKEMSDVEKILLEGYHTLIKEFFKGSPEK